MLAPFKSTLSAARSYSVAETRRPALQGGRDLRSPCGHGRGDLVLRLTGPGGPSAASFPKPEVAGSKPVRRFGSEPAGCARSKKCKHHRLSTNKEVTSDASPWAAPSGRPSGS